MKLHVDWVGGHQVHRSAQAVALRRRPRRCRLQTGPGPLDLEGPGKGHTDGVSSHDLHCVVPECEGLGVLGVRQWKKPLTLISSAQQDPATLCCPSAEAAAMPTLLKASVYCFFDTLTMLFFLLPKT